MFDAAVTLLFRGRNKLAVTDDSSCAIAVECIETKNDHQFAISPLRFTRSQRLSLTLPKLEYDPRDDTDISETLL